MSGKRNFQVFAAKVLGRFSLPLENRGCNEIQATRSVKSISGLQAASNPIENPSITDITEIKLQKQQAGQAQPSTTAVVIENQISGAQNQQNQSLQLCHTCALEAQEKQTFPHMEDKNCEVVRQIVLERAVLTDIDDRVEEVDSPPRMKKQAQISMTPGFKSCNSPANQSCYKSFQKPLQVLNSFTPFKASPQPIENRSLSNVNLNSSIRNISSSAEQNILRNFRSPVPERSNWKRQMAMCGYCQQRIEKGAAGGLACGHRIHKTCGSEIRRNTKVCKHCQY